VAGKSPGRMRAFTFKIRRPDVSVRPEPFYALDRAAARKLARGWSRRMGYELVDESSGGIGSGGGVTMAAQTHQAVYRLRRAGFELMRLPDGRWLAENGDQKFVGRSPEQALAVAESYGALSAEDSRNEDPDGQTSEDDGSRHELGAEPDDVTAAVTDADSHRAEPAHSRNEARCGGCGQAFAPTRSGARYCSSSCRQKAYRERKRATPEVV
jgi:hypothetical protein